MILFAQTLHPKGILIRAGAGNSDRENNLKNQLKNQLYIYYTMALIFEIFSFYTPKRSSFARAQANLTEPRHLYRRFRF
jgi:hypothetical protein